MSVSLETYLEQHREWSNDAVIENEIEKLEEKMYRVCMSMERGKITMSEADKKYEPLSLKRKGLCKIQRERNSVKCAAFDAVIAEMRSSQQDI